MLWIILLVLLVPGKTEASTLYQPGYDSLASYTEKAVQMKDEAISREERSEAYLQLDILFEQAISQTDRAYEKRVSVFDRQRKSETRAAERRAADEREAALKRLDRWIATKKPSAAKALQRKQALEQSLERKRSKKIFEITKRYTRKQYRLQQSYDRINAEIIDLANQASQAISERPEL